MKTLILIIIAAFSLASCSTGDSTPTTGKDSTVIADTANYTTIQWIDSIKDVGFVEKGKVAEIKFVFRNTGDKPLFIISAQPGCGCTVANYPKNAISPDEEGEITANYDSNKGSVGDFRKSITVTTNTKNGTSHYLFLRGEVMNKGDSMLIKKTASDTTNAL